jgi:alpha-D-ribose 1-methylphosphonate 5-triphosphate diphosphatase PhnM
MDIISTDYNSGNWDGIYEGIGRIIKEGYLNIPQAIALGTGNVRKIFPRLAQDRGLIQKGLAADFIITDFNDIAQIRQVFIKGECVYDSENMR